MHKRISHSYDIRTYVLKLTINLMEWKRFIVSISTLIITRVIVKN
jgi:hypothetical protein